jgi:formamidopyrimidine-DNA glycosylase
MPELPDLLYIQKYLQKHIVGRTVTGAEVKQPVILRNALDRPLEELMRGRRIDVVRLAAPFLAFQFDEEIELVLNLMLAGRIQHQRPHEKAEAYCCLTLLLDNGARLNICDEQQMAKAYLVRRGAYSAIPNYERLGVSILSPEFTRSAFRELAMRHARKQVRVMINDHTILSSIGNAYADEILFDAGIHPKTFVGKLTAGDLDRLYDSILSVMRWGIAAVETASQPIHVKVRDHMKVRNRKGHPCPHCGTTIRREGVRGYDVFFCPTCQPASRKVFIDWRKVREDRTKDEQRKSP